MPYVRDEVPDPEDVISVDVARLLKGDLAIGMETPFAIKPYGGATVVVTAAMFDAAWQLVGREVLDAAPDPADVWALGVFGPPDEEVS